MKILPLVAAALVAANLGLGAQDEVKKPAQAMPEPKQKEHDALKALVGSWEIVMKTEGVPGVPGMEKPTESKGIERAELVCNGLWLKSVIDSTWQGEPFQGIWLAGYDPSAKKYKSLWVSSDEAECGLAAMDGTFDEKTRTWAWSGDTPHGPMRSTIVFKDGDNSVESCFMKTPDGKELKCMEITRKRTKAPAAVEASAKALPKVAKEIELLHKDIGEWDATVLAAAAPGQQPTAESAVERVSAACLGRWLWSDFKGQFMGAPFEGHALMGYDTNQKKYVSIWIDSMSAAAAQTLGTFDAAKKAYTFNGSSVDPTGKPMTINEVVTWKDDNTRVLKMEFKCDDQVSNMEITYKRKTKG
jgi:hypothetical protein